MAQIIQIFIEQQKIDMGDMADVGHKGDMGNIGDTGDMRDISDNGKMGDIISLIWVLLVIS